jgi:hypothetical protein
MIDPSWRRIAGFHVEDDGTIGAVWLAFDTVTSTLHCYDAAIFRAEVQAVVVDAIASRGRKFPMAWRKQDKAYAKALEDAGVRITYEPAEDTQSVAQVITREVWQKLRTGQFRVERRLQEWLREFKNFDYKDSEVPMNGFPLMAATRHAIEKLPYARPEKVPGQTKQKFKKVAIV